MQYLGDFAEDATVVFDFNVFDANGEPVALVGTLANSIQVYKSGSTTPYGNAYTPAVLNSLTGVYRVEIDMSLNDFFAAGVNYAAILTGASITADGVAVTNTVLRTWSCANRTAKVVNGSLTADSFATGVLATDADIADAVWDEPRADHATADTFGEGIATTSAANTAIATAVWAVDASTSITLGSVKQTLVTDIPGDIAALNDLDSAAVTAACTSSLTTYDPPTRTEATADKDAILAALPSSGPSAATIADAVLDEALSGHATAGTLGKAVTDILAGGSAPTAAAIADAVWTEAIADHSGEAGSTAEALNNAGAAGTVSTAQVSNERTWFAEEYRSRNIVTVGNGFAGTFAVVPDINPETTIASVSSVAITGAASVTASSSAVRADKQAAHFTVPALTTSGTYTVVVKVLTNDSQTIPTTCVLKVI